VAFGVTVYVARVVGAEGYGVIAFAMAALLYLNRLVDAGADLGLGVREIAMRPGEADQIASSLIGARLLLAVVVMALTVALAWALLPSPDGAVLSAYALTLLAVAMSTRWVHLGLERASRVAVARVAGEAVVLLAVLLAVRGPEDLVRVPLAQFAGEMLASVVLLLWLRRAGHAIGARLDWALTLPLLLRAVPLVASSLLGLMVYNADFIFLRVMRGAASVGLYAAAYTLMSFLINIGYAYSLSLLPALARLSSAPAEQRALYHSASAHVIAASLPVAVGGFVLAPQIIGVVFGEEYAPAAIALRFIIWAVPLCVLRDVPIIALMAAGREDSVLRITGIAALSTLVLNVLLIPPYGIAGAAAATVLTEGIRLVVAQWYSTRLGFGVTSVARYWRSALAAAVMTLALIAAAEAPLPVSVLAGGVVYVAVLAAVGGIRLRRGALPELTV
jgi:O-antigen/teichoic acid export membrane protein